MAETILCIINSENYFKGVISILRELKSKNIVYVTTNKPCSSISNMCDEAKINCKNIFFIDCISKTVGIKKESKQCLLLESPQSLTSIGIAINEVVNQLKGNAVLLLDSLSTLLLYNDAETVYKFSNFLINKMRMVNVQTIVIAIESDLQKNIIKQIEALADKIKRIN